MLDLNKRLALIAEVTAQQPSLGKTAMMKIIFILQQVYKVPLGYDFEIYTYGPYSANVMGDIQLASDFDVVEIAAITYPTGYSGYIINPTISTESCINKERKFVDSHRGAISEVVKIFGKKAVKDLELSSTIIYVYNAHSINKMGMSIEDVVDSVKKIKPHFNIEIIKSEYKNLDKINILKKAL